MNREGHKKCAFVAPDDTLLSTRRTSCPSPDRKPGASWYGRCSRKAGDDSPVAVATRKAPPMSPLGNIGDSLSPLILVVDDHADHREVYSTTLRFSGFRTEEAENGAVALEKAITFAPDAILLDHAMPVMDGREAARRLRGDERTRRIALVMLTGFDRASARGREVRADGHCDAYLAKPCAGDQLVAAVRVALRSQADRSTGDVRLNQLSP